MARQRRLGGGYIKKRKPDPDPLPHRRVGNAWGGADQSGPAEVTSRHKVPLKL